MDSTSQGPSLGLIALGAVVGALSRHALAVGLPDVFPWGTLVANVLGAFLLAVVLYGERLADHLSPEIRLLVGTGFCSSFTTYSTFAAETAMLSPELAAANVLANYALGFLGVLLGREVVQWST
jgi:CrcB protein